MKKQSCIYKGIVRDRDMNKLQRVLCCQQASSSSSSSSPMASSCNSPPAALGSSWFPCAFLRLFGCLLGFVCSIALLPGPTTMGWPGGGW